ncbi:MAG: NTP transferase domain-containing protein [Trueperaceae bacterium]|nr:NTP transferase domain-containing protein [Trueperaceae bacterium]
MSGAAGAPEAASAVPASPAAVILAAGQGTRMRSSLPKVVHQVAGRPMIAHVVRTAREAGADPIVVVVGHGADAVREALGDAPVRFARQAEQLGTGHALACARSALRDHDGPLFVLNGDGPLLRPATLRAMASVHGVGAEVREDRPGMTLATVRVDDPRGLGRIVRDAGGALTEIVEEADADEATRAIHEVNPGVYLVDAGVWEHLGRLGTDNAQNETYVTDLPARYLASGQGVRTVEMTDPDEALAANDRTQLARLERVARMRIARRWMDEGVTMLAPASTFLDDDVVLARDVVLEPFVMLLNGTTVGEGARIGAGAHLTSCVVAPGAAVAANVVARDARFEASSGQPLSR